jgi:hypothetical protein
MIPWSTRLKRRVITNVGFVWMCIGAWIFIQHAPVWANGLTLFLVGGCLWLREDLEDGN